MKKVVPIIVAALIALAARAYVAIPFDLLPFLPMDDIIVAVGAVATIIFLRSICNSYSLYVST